MKSYWNRRRERNKAYYKQIVNYSREFAADAQTSLDVGNYGCEYVYELDWIPKRTVLDVIEDMFSLDDRIEKIKADFLLWNPPHKYDLVTCLQVLEHFDDPMPFIDKLRQVQGNVLIVSLPYMWPTDHTPSHKHDPISLNTIHFWLGDNSVAETIITEENGTQRWMGVYVNRKS
jgi:hypothetical protein